MQMRLKHALAKIRTLALCDQRLGNNDSSTSTETYHRPATPPIDALDCDNEEYGVNDVSVYLCCSPESGSGQ